MGASALEAHTRVHTVHPCPPTLIRGHPGEQSPVFGVILQHVSGYARTLIHFYAHGSR